MKASEEKRVAGKWVKVWDPLVRTGHWLLVAGFFVAWLSEDDLEIVHAWAGYLVGAIVALRLVWGLIGTRHARFTDFVFAPATVVRYVRSVIYRRSIRYLGHNPLGGWMVVALLVMLSLTTWSGLEAYALEGKGPLAAATPIASVLADGKDRYREEQHSEEFWEELHEFCADLTLVLVILHIAGVLFSSVIHRENLVASMLTGYKRKLEP